MYDTVPKLPLKKSKGQMKNKNPTYNTQQQKKQTPSKQQQMLTVKDLDNGRRFLSFSRSLSAESEKQLLRELTRSE